MVRANLHRPLGIEFGEVRHSESLAPEFLGDRFKRCDPHDERRGGVSFPQRLAVRFTGVQEEIHAT